MRHSNRTFDRQALFVGIRKYEAETTIEARVSKEPRLEGPIATRRCNGQKDESLNKDELLDEEAEE